MLQAVAERRSLGSLRFLKHRKRTSHGPPPLHAQIGESPALLQTERRAHSTSLPERRQENLVSLDMREGKAEGEGLATTPFVSLTGRLWLKWPTSIRWLLRELSQTSNRKFSWPISHHVMPQMLEGKKTSCDVIFRSFLLLQGFFWPHHMVDAFCWLCVVAAVVCRLASLAPPRCKTSALTSPKRSVQQQAAAALVL